MNFEGLLKLANYLRASKKVPARSAFYAILIASFYLVIDYYFYNLDTLYNSDIFTNWKILEAIYFKENHILLSGIFTFITIIFIWLISRLFYYYWSQRDYVLDVKKIRKDWAYQGFLKEKDGGFQLNYSDGGCILKNRSWRNYEMNFKFKCNPPVEQKGFGIIIRAKDLENYLMLKIDDHISPHVKKGGLWVEILSPNDIFTRQFVDGKDHVVKLSVIDNELNMILDNDLEYRYNIPTHINLNPANYGVLKDNEFKNELAILPMEKETLSTEIDFNEAGSIGFRVWGYIGNDTESVIIKNLSVKNLRVEDKKIKGSK